jgi:hypothetical protein
VERKKIIQIILTVLGAIGVTVLCCMYWPQIVQEVQNFGQLFQEPEKTATKEKKHPTETGFTKDIYTYSDVDIQATLHKMAHQKVYAEEKWGYIAITPQRIDSLIAMIEERKNELEQENLYLEILKRWQKNDFSQAVNDHNRIWEMQNGNIGPAIKLLTPEEELQYINSQKDEG